MAAFEYAPDKSKPDQTVYIVNDLSVLLNALHSPDATARKDAAWELAAIGHPISAPGLLALLCDDDPQVRWVGAAAIHALDEEVVLPALMDALLGDDACARQAAAWALQEIGSIRALDMIAAWRASTQDH